MFLVYFFFYFFETQADKSHILIPLIPHTCDLHFKCQFFSSNFADVFSSVFLLYAVEYQLTVLATWLHVNCSAGCQQFAILVPFYLCLVINYLTAQGGFLWESGFHFPLDRLFVEESGFCPDVCKEAWWQDDYSTNKDLTPQHRHCFGCNGQTQPNLTDEVHRAKCSKTTHSEIKSPNLWPGNDK